MVIGALVYLFIGGVFAALHNAAAPECHIEELLFVVGAWPIIIAFLVWALLYVDP